MSRILLAMIAATLLAACGAPQIDIAQAKADILSAEQRELDGWAARDVDAIMQAYTDDVQIMAAGARVRDNAAARDFFTRVLGDPGFTLTFRSDEPIVAASGDLGVATGTYSMTYTDRETNQVERVNGYHLLTWVKDAGGVWRIRRQLTGEAPPEDPQQ